MDIGDVDVLSSALPTGASTSAKQDTMITALQLIDNIVLAEDAAHSTGDVGVQALTVRQDTAAALGGTDGDYQPLVTDASGRLHVNVGNTVTVASHAVTNAGTFATQVDGAALTALQLIDNLVLLEDAAHVSGDPGVQMLAIRDDTLNIRSGAENDYEPLHTDANGALWVRHTSDSVAVTHAALTELAAAINASSQMDVNLAASNATVTVAAHAVTNAGTFAVQVDGAALTALQLIDDVVFAEDAAASSGEKGVSNLGVRTDVPNTALTSATADYAHMTTDMVGGQRMALYETDFAVLGTNHVKKYYTSAGAVTDGIVWSPAAGKRWYVTDIAVNVSAACTVTFEDDKAGGDEVVGKFEFAANSGWDHGFQTPWFSGEDAADLLVTTTAGNIYITITGYEI